MNNLYVLGLACRSIGILFIAVVASLLLSRMSASVKRLVWVFAVIAVIALPFVWRVAPAVEVATEKIPGLAKVMQQPTVTKFTELSEKLDSTSERDLDEISAPSRASSERQEPVNWIVLSWLAASTLLTCRLVLSLILSRRLVSNAEEIHHKQFDETFSALGLGRPVRLLVSSMITTPATVGWIRPVVLLPKDSLEWDTQTLQSALAHELAHVKQGDWLVRCLSQVATVMYPFNPLVWMAAARLRTESEFAADDCALRIGIAPTEYAKRLLEIASRSNRSYALVVPMARSPKVESRLRAILDKRRQRGAAAKVVIVALGLIGAIACVAIASLRLGNPKTAPVKEPQAALALSPATGSGWKGPILVKVVDEHFRPVKEVRLAFRLDSENIVGAGVSIPPAITEADGTFKVDPSKLRSPNSLSPNLFESMSLDTVLAYRPGYAYAKSDQVKKGDSRVVIVLRKSHSLRVPVLDVEGHPVTGATVSAKRITWPDKDVTYVPAEWSSKELSGTSDANGVATIPDMPAGAKVTLALNDELYLPLPRNQHNPVLTGDTPYPAVRAIPSSYLEGTVRLNGKPLSGVHLQADFLQSPSVQTAVTDSNGHYRITRIPSCICNVHYVTLGETDKSVPPGFVARQHNSLIVGTHQTIRGLDFDFVPQSVIHGHITDSSGKPVQFMVEALQLDFKEFDRGAASNPGDFGTMSNPDGSYKLPVPPGNYLIRCGRGLEGDKSVVEIAAGKTVEFNLKLPLPNHRDSTPMTKQ